MVTRRVGQGRISYLGAWLDERTLMRVLKLQPLPAGIEVSRRGAVSVVINHGQQTRTVKVAGKSLRVRGGDVVVAKDGRGGRI